MIEKYAKKVVIYWFVFFFKVR